MSHIWLMKSEPATFSIADLQESKITGWEGVRNYQARNMLRDEMQVGDRVLFYHSNCAIPGIAGLAEVVRASYPDPTAFDPSSPYFDEKSDPTNPRWYQVDVKFIRKFPHIITLAQLRATFGLEAMWVLRKGNRLSITPVTAKEYAIILQLSETENG